MRRRHRDEKNKEIADLKKELERTKMLVQEKDDKLNLKNVELEKEKRKSEKEKGEKNDDWLKQVYKNLSSDGKRQFREAFITASPEIERGTVSRLRKAAGMNFSISPANSEHVKSETKLKNRLKLFCKSF